MKWRFRYNLRPLYGMVAAMVLGLSLLWFVQPHSREAAAHFWKGLVVIDAGHGGFDPGTIGTETGVYEDGLNLKVALYVKEELQARGIRAVLTREDHNALAHTKKQDMQERERIIAESGADVAVSIHMNANTVASVSGPMVIYHRDSEEGQVLGNLVQRALNETLQPPKAKTASGNDFFILRAGTMPCIIVECGFLSNAREERLLQQEDYQRSIARAIADGIQKYLVGGKHNGSKQDSSMLK